jgi:hypothetical protein
MIFPPQAHNPIKVIPHLKISNKTHRDAMHPLSL